MSFIYSRVVKRLFKKNWKQMKANPIRSLTLSLVEGGKHLAQNQGNLISFLFYIVMTPVLYPWI